MRNQVQESAVMFWDKNLPKKQVYCLRNNSMAILSLTIGWTTLLPKCLKLVFYHLLPAVTSKYCPQWDRWGQCIQNGLMQDVPWFPHRNGNCNLFVKWKPWKFSFFPKTVVGKGLQVIHSPLVLVTIVIHHSLGQLSAGFVPSVRCGLLGCLSQSGVAAH